MDAMGFRVSLLATVLVIGAATPLACTTDYQQGKGDPSYGGPNALAGQRPPGTTADNADGGGASSGGLVPGAKPKCVAAGGALADAGTCAVSFAKDVLGAYALASCATASCHGGATPLNQPRIATAASDAPAMWQEFQAFTISTGQPYINPCSTDDTKSAMGCNLLADPAACKGGVHMPSGAQMPADAVAKINTWLKCGAPNN